MSLPMRNRMGVTNLLPSAKQTKQVGWSGKAYGGGKWKDNVIRREGHRKMEKKE